MIIYDYIKVDKILGKLDIDPNQFHLLYLLYHRKEGNTSNAQLERYKEEVLKYMDDNELRKRIDDLVDKGLIENFNPISQESGRTYKYYNVDNFLVTPKFADKVFIATEEAGEELWRKYPASMPIGANRFVSRAGDKEKIIQVYAKKIKNDITMHKFVLKMLESYKQMVKEGKINAHKIGDFVEGEIWYAIEEILKEDQDGEFGKDI